MKIKLTVQQFCDNQVQHFDAIHFSGVMQYGEKPFCEMVCKLAEEIEKALNPILEKQVSWLAYAEAVHIYSLRNAHVLMVTSEVETFPKKSNANPDHN